MKFKMILILVLFSFFSCKDSNDSGFNNNGNNPTDNEWLIPWNEVKDGGPGKDGIPSLSTPPHSNNEAMEDYMEEDDLIIGIKVGNVVRGYPHIILDWHEIINDQIGDAKFALTYCPLTGTGIAWDRILNNGEETTFGVSGLLYNTNLIPYDRKTDSNWSQMRNECVNGNLSGEDPVQYQVIETKWSTWKSMFPEAEVVGVNTGFDRNYGNYPYGTYINNNDYLIFPISPDDDRLPRKERVLGIRDNRDAKVYRFSSFSTSAIQIISDQYKGDEIIVVGNADKEFMVAFKKELSDGSVPQLIPSNSNARFVMQDSNGNKYDLFGTIVEGPNEGEYLIPEDSYMGYWLAWGSFYIDAEIYGN